jgi:tetratricopeptide (TPR) repeat protein
LGFLIVSTNLEAAEKKRQGPKVKEEISREEEMVKVETDPVVLLAKAKEAFDLKHYPEAEKYYRRVLGREPRNLAGLNGLASAQFKENKPKQAEETLKRAVAVAPGDVEAHRLFGIVEYSMQNYDEAVNELTKAIAIKPDDAVAHNYLGITASQKGWQEASQKELQLATALDPKYADAYFNLAVVYATLYEPRKEKARECYRHALELGSEPDSALEAMTK